MNYELGIRNFTLALIIILAVILRFWRLDSYPALNADEAAIGYNAYSLIQTGKDEHGNPWPIHFQSFNDYKPGLYFYLVLPFVKILGLNEWAVRIPGATLGVLTVLILYFLVKELFPNQKMEGRRWNMENIASVLLAISPWHIHFSRGGWEVNVATFFISLGVLLFLKGIKRPVFLYLGSLVFVLSLYVYHVSRIMVPLLLFGALTIYLKEVKGKLKEFIVAGVIGGLLLAPLAKDLLGPAGISRAAGVGLFADTGPLSRINEQRGEHEDFNSLIPKILHNKAVNYGLAFAQNWAAHFHGEFLFLSGDLIQRNKVPETGVLYLFDIFFMVVGFISIFRNYRLNAKSYSLLLLWLIVAPIASALTFQSPHALRAHNMLIPLTIISAYGLLTILTVIRDTKYEIRLACYVLLITFMAWSFTRYEHMYWLHMSKEYPFSSQYGLKELAFYLRENSDKYQKIWVTDRYDQPYILFLFYNTMLNPLKYPPEKFQKEHVLTSRDQYGFSTVRDFGKFHFEAVNFDKIRPENPSALIIGMDEEIPEEANIVSEIYGTNGYKYFQVVAN